MNILNIICSCVEIEIRVALNYEVMRCKYLISGCEHGQDFILLYFQAGLNIEDMINEYDRYTSLSGDDDDDYEESASVDDQYDHE